MRNVIYYIAKQYKKRINKNIKRIMNANIDYINF